MEVPEVAIHRRSMRALAAFNENRFHWLDEAMAAGPVAALKVGPARVYIVSDPEIARSLLLGRSEHWSRPPASRFPLRIAVGDNLFTASDEVWQIVQPAVSPSFRKRALAERLSAIDDIIDDDVHALPYDTGIDLDLAMGRLSLRLAAWVLLGDRLEPDRAEQIAKHQREAVRWVGERIASPLSAVPFSIGSKARSMRGHSAVLSAYADEVIARRRASRKRGGSEADSDVLDALIDARPGDKPLSDRDLTSHVLGLFLAGNETTAASLSWALVHAANHPDEWAKVRSTPSAAKHFITETHRLTPAVWGFVHIPAQLFASKSHRSFTTPTGTVTLRPGLDAITTYTRGINRDADRWDDPTRFDPSRHINASSEQRQSMLTFGLGPRGCIGQHLATAELNASIPRLAAHADIEITQSIEEDPSFALRVKGGLIGTLRRPKSAAQQTLNQSPPQ